MELFALTEDFELVTADIPYFNLQWQRRYYQPGQFSMQISADVFDKSWRYICTHDRPEVGVVQKVNMRTSVERSSCRCLVSSQNND